MSRRRASCRSTIMVTMHRVVLALLLLAGTAHADEPVRDYENYGHKVVIVDAIGATVFTGAIVFSLNIESDAKYWGILPALIGGGIYIAGSSAVHVGHDNLNAAKGTPWLKTLLPTVGMFGGAKLAVQLGGSEWVGAAIGASTAAVVATGVDAMWIARTPRGAMPYVAPGAGGATVGLAGRF